MATQIRRLAGAFTLAFLGVALAAGYWGMARSEALLARGDNPRRVLDERRIARGTIFDRNDAVLAKSVGDLGALTRTYPYPALAPVLGYVSPLYGLAGTEAAYDEILHGGAGVDPFDLFWQNTVLGQPPAGRDVRLTLDLRVQTAADEALGDHHGAVVVMDIRTGHLLALASHPTYDAGNLEAEWEMLVNDQAAPLLNRTVLGLYQPGGAAWPLTLAAAAMNAPSLLADDYPSDGGLPDGQPAICRQPISLTRISVRESLLFGCPAPIAAIGEVVGADALDGIFAAFQIFTPPILSIPTTSAESAPASDAALAAIGQAGWAWTPLRAALVMAAIAGDGTMPAPQLLLATQGANGIWRPATPEGQAVTAITPEAAAQVRALLPAGYAALAQTGTQGQILAWYLDFAPRDAARYVVVALLEDGDAVLARAIGQRVLATAASQ